jgi:hypothetical protein
LLLPLLQLVALGPPRLPLPLYVQLLQLLLVQLVLECCYAWEADGHVEEEQQVTQAADWVTSCCGGGGSSCCTDAIPSFLRHAQREAISQLARRGEGQQCLQSSNDHMYGLSGELAEDHRKCKLHDWRPPQEDSHAA